MNNHFSALAGLLSAHLKIIDRITYPVFLLVHEWASPYAGAEVASAVVWVFAIVGDRAVQRMIIQVVSTALPVAPMVERRRNLEASRTLAFSLALDLRDINIDLRLGAEVAHELAVCLRWVRGIWARLPHLIGILSQSLPSAAVLDILHRDLMRQHQPDLGRLFPPIFASLPQRWVRWLRLHSIRAQRLPVRYRRRRCRIALWWAILNLRWHFRTGQAIPRVAVGTCMATVTALFWQVLNQLLMRRRNVQSVHIQLLDRACLQLSEHPLGLVTWIPENIRWAVCLLWLEGPPPG